MFSEVTEVRDAIHLLTPRAINEDVGRALARETAWYNDHLTKGGADRSANTTPGDKKGGLANIVEIAGKTRADRRARRRAARARRFVGGLRLASAKLCLGRAVTARCHRARPCPVAAPAHPRRTRLRA